MIIIRNKIIPFGKKYYAINLFGILFAKGPCNKIVVNHEMIHTAQIKELLYVFFYLAYILEWIYRILQFRKLHEAYLNISFEREAYANQNNLKYLENRRRFSFLKYKNRFNTKT